MLVSNWGGDGRVCVHSLTLKFFQKIPQLQKITYLTSLLPLPPPYLPNITPSTPRLWSCSFPCEKKPLSASRGRGVVDVRSSSSSSSSSSSRQHSSGFACSQHFFSPSVIAAAPPARVPAPSVRPWSQSTLGQHPNFCLPACLTYLEISFRAFTFGSSQHPNKRRLLSQTLPVRVACPSVVDRPP